MDGINAGVLHNYFGGLVCLKIAILLIQTANRVKGKSRKVCKICIEIDIAFTCSFDILDKRRAFYGDSSNNLISSFTGLFI